MWSFVFSKGNSLGAVLRDMTREQWHWARGWGGGHMPDKGWGGTMRSLKMLHKGFWCTSEMHWVLEADREMQSFWPWTKKNTREQRDLGGFHPPGPGAGCYHMLCSSGKISHYVIYIYFQARITLTIKGSIYRGIKFGKKEIMFGTPGWLSRISVCLWLRSWSQGAGIESGIGLPTQQGVCFSLCCSCACLLSLPCSLPLSLQSINKILKKYIVKMSIPPPKQSP